jgi:hypothetical protein
MRYCVLSLGAFFLASIFARSMRVGGVGLALAAGVAVCLAQRLRAVGRIVSNIYDGELAGYGLTTSQFELLAALLELGTASQNKIASVRQHSEIGGGGRLEPVCIGRRMTHRGAISHLRK